MYIVNIEKKELVKMEECTFKSEDLKERYDLQEWISKEPSVFGEELLIIQKEFSKFADTNERLDLLALDKNGRLVIIENKLDDSGRDVTWQAIKYASYCSGLGKQDIINIYQDYLGATGIAANAITDFFDVKDIDDISINNGPQRIFLVAANFRKEVTSSVLWLRNFNIDICCFKITPYKLDGKIIVDFDSIIPLPETKDFQIRMANKEMEEVETTEATKKRHDNRRAFWSEFIDFCKKNSGLYSTSNPTSESYVTKSIPNIPGGLVNVVINKNCSRTEVYLDSTAEINKKVFDCLYDKREMIEKEIPGLMWERMDNKKSSRIRIDSPYCYLNEDDKYNLFTFFIETSNLMMKVFNEEGKKINI
jgi:hypothetical protein